LKNKGAPSAILFFICLILAIAVMVFTGVKENKEPCSSEGVITA